MIEMLRNLNRGESGQDIIEYVLIAAFVTTGVIAIVSAVGQWILNSWKNLNKQLT